VDITLADGTLHARFGNEDLGRLEPRAYESFAAVGPPPLEERQVVTFVPDGVGQVASLRAFGITFLRVPRPR